jgi:hypothetical protein
MKGQFTAAERVPRGQPAPTGNTLTLVVDALSGSAVSRTISNATPDLRAINPSITTLAG